MTLYLYPPDGAFVWKTECFKRLRRLLRQRGIAIETVERYNLAEYMKRGNRYTFLLVDEDEARGEETLYRFVLDDIPKVAELWTYKNHIKLASIVEKGLMEKALKCLQEQGVSILTLYIAENQSGFLARFHALVEQKYKRFGLDKQLSVGNVLYDVMKPDFLGEIYTDKYRNVALPFPWRIKFIENIPCLEDEKSPLLNVRNGERITLGQPEQYEKSIYFYGPCTMFGYFVEDRHTIESFLQNRLNEDEIFCRVVNQGGPAVSPVEVIKKLLHTPFRAGDIVIIMFWTAIEDLGYGKFDSIPSLNLTDVAEANQIKPEWVTDHLAHCNYKCNRIYADAIYRALLPRLREPVPNRSRIDARAELDEFLCEVYRRMYGSLFAGRGVTGAIVMNCNPFTFGHRYLIEQALEQVDTLVIFVVEEDRSLFSFEERFSMVHEGVADLKNVVVVPSGDMILSKRTFPGYFVKIVDENLEEETKRDITLFAKNIAPALHISYRFAGEEPEDEVTAVYNRAMQSILPTYGIRFVEIPRKRDGGRVISASAVRKCLETGDMDTLRRLVPQTTIDILFAENR